MKGSTLTREERIAKAAELVAIGGRARDPRRRRQLVQACIRLLRPIWPR